MTTSDILLLFAFFVISVILNKFWKKYYPNTYYQKNSFNPIINTSYFYLIALVFVIVSIIVEKIWKSNIPVLLFFDLIFAYYGIIFLQQGIRGIVLKRTDLLEFRPPGNLQKRFATERKGPSAILLGLMYLLIGIMMFIPAVFLLNLVISSIKF